jgi:hypothetical protein
MTDESRPPNWNWVKATHECNAQAMFGELRGVARANIQERNKQLGREAFKLIEINGIDFLIRKDDSIGDTVGFRVLDDLARISIVSDRTKEQAIYTVGLDPNGACKFKRNGGDFDAWQVLKVALSPLFFEE